MSLVIFFDLIFLLGVHQVPDTFHNFFGHGITNEHFNNRVFGLVTPLTGIHS